MNTLSYQKYIDLLNTIERLYTLPDSIRTDIEFIRRRTDKSIEMKSLFSWRPWSSFEPILTTAIYQALQDILRIFIDSADETLAENGDIWSLVSSTFKQAVSPIMQDIASKAVEDTYKVLSGSEMSVSFDLTNQIAREWAYTYSADQIKGIDETTRKAVRKTIGDWIEAGRTDGNQGLQSRLESMIDANGVPLFGKERAERIGVSEITSIYAGAKEQALIKNDYPPTVYKPRAHVNCRCYLQPGRLASGEKVIVWYTARDERVCIVELDTPWGAVKGCKELHRKIVSEGHAGEDYQR